MSASRLRLIAVTLPLLLWGHAAIAQSAPPAAWDQLTPAQRDLLIAPVRERWNSADAPTRERMLENARRWEAMTPAERAQARHGMHSWKHLPPEQREEVRALYNKLRTLPEADRQALRERWKEMSPEQRRRWAAENPAPSRDSGRER
ncbi:MULTISPECIES: DUF3106 domain-containing protein [Luteimonas]|uniref:DUF3106 domain-containing protein n=1 Tax=Luteimonas chenhongjianii TaxID=2006110 RepID=A0A290XDN0_9GAMM|nr:MULTISPECIES: DUF3106 domain-containing protein [Luteimonas]ATD67046.1 hypothetical protein CNR27_05970 [Luteimonas chenhongjianii]RPD84367.1 DUF3106 domain-containing protein [Luteimonas sp. 100069]